MGKLDRADHGLTVGKVPAKFLESSVDYQLTLTVGSYMRRAFRDAIIL